MKKVSIRSLIDFHLREIKRLVILMEDLKNEK